jgi:hypothetical protein
MQEEKYVVRSPWSEVEIPETNLADFVWQDVSQHADLQAMVSHHVFTITLSFCNEK